MFLVRMAVTVPVMWIFCDGLKTHGYENLAANICITIVAFVVYDIVNGF
jgi:putative flippase GtrA